MPDISGSPYSSLGAFDPTSFRGMTSESRVTLAGDTVISDSEVSRGMFGRGISCLSRSKEEVQENKDTAKAFVAKLKEAYGEEIGEAMAQKLRGHADGGKPLTVYRIVVIAQEASRLAGKNTGHNAPIMKDALPGMLTLPDGTSPRVPNPKALEGAVKKAIMDDVRFKGGKFSTTAEFQAVFKEVAGKAVEKEMARQMRPHSLGEVEGGMEKDDLAMDAIGTPLEGLPPEDKRRFNAAEELLNKVQKRLTGDAPPSPMPLGDAMRDLADLHRMQALLKPGSNPGDDACMDDRAGSPPLTPEAAKRREAMMKDMKHLAGMLEGQLGLNGLQDKEKEALHDLHGLVEKGSKDVNAGDWTALGSGDLDKNIADIRKHLATLADTEPTNDAGEELLTAMRNEATRVLSHMEAIRSMKTAGVDARDLTALAPLGLDVPKLAKMIPIDPVAPVPPSVGQIFGVMKGIAQLSSDVRAGNWDAVQPHLDTHLSTLPVLLRSLESIPSPRPTEMQEVIDVLKRECESLQGTLTDAKAALAKGFTAADLKEAVTAGVSFKDLAAKFSEAEVRAMHLAPPMTIPQAMKYKELGLPITEHTRPTKDVLVSSTPGSTPSAPVRAKFERTDSVSGLKTEHEVMMRHVTGTETPNITGHKLGIPGSDSHMVARGLAVGRLDERLKFGLVPKMQVHVSGTGEVGVTSDYVPGPHRGPGHSFVDIGSSGKPEHIALHSELQTAWILLPDADYRDLLAAKGVTVGPLGEYLVRTSGLDDLRYDDQNLQKDLVRLQLLDAISGQGERHAGSYIVQRDTDGAYKGLKVVDNNQCLGKDPSDPNALLGPPRGTDGLGGVRLPKVITTEMQKAVREMELGDLEKDLQGMSDLEITAAKARLTALKEHIEAGSPTCIVTDDWSTDEVQRLLTAPENIDSSYVGRDFAEYGGRVVRPYEDIVG